MATRETGATDIDIACRCERLVVANPKKKP
jgi:hypothetical protein